MKNSLKTVGINRTNDAILVDNGMTTDAVEDNHKITGSAIDSVFQRQDLVTDTD